jgi:ABC-type multidrug transport system ATPase subunit
MLQSTATAVASPERPAESLLLENVGKRYGRRAYVLRGLTETFAPGTATALIGPNGSGKTTLLRLLNCLSFPTEGRILYGDLDVHARPYRWLAHVGVVHDGGELPERLSAEEVVAWVLRARTGGAPAERIAEVLQAVRLDERRSEPIGTYSTGMRQKTQLAAAIAPRPPVLLLDEPFSGLDAETVVATISLLDAFKAAGGLLIFSTHQAEILDALADRRLVMGEESGVGGQES